MVALVLLTAAAVGLLTYRNIEVAVVPGELDRIRTAVRQLAVELEVYVRSARSDVLGFRAAAALDGIMQARLAGGVHPRDGTTEATWRARMAARYASELAIKPAYYQFRIIGAADGGREILRVDRSGPGNSIRVVPDGELQRKGDRDYFIRAIRLADGEVDISPIELNQEGGTIETPRVPVLRAGTPVYTPDGQPFAIVIINVDMRPAFGAIRSSARGGGQVYVVNERGDYLVHPDPGREFGFELGQPIRWQDDFPGLADALTRDQSDIRWERAVDGRQLVVAAASVRLAGGPRVVVVETVPYSEILAPFASVRRSTLLAGLAAALCAIALAVVLARSLTGPLRQMIAATEVFTNGKPMALPITAAGEIGVLARAFARARDEVREKTVALERTAKEHHDAAETLRTVIEEAPIGIMCIDMEGRVIIWNLAAERIFGYSAEEVLGRPYPIVAPEGEALQTDSVRARLRSGESMRDMELRRRRKDGSIVEIIASGVPLYDADGKLRGNIGIVTDVTERRRVEQQLRQAQKMETVGQLAGGLAHDFNNMLTVIIGGLDLLIEELVDRPRAKEKAETALAAGLHGAELTHQLLAFSRRQTLQPKVVAINAFVGGMTKLLTRTLGEGVEIGMKLADDLWPALIDPSQLEAALANLAINARDAMPAGGRLTIETANTHLDADYAALNPEVAVGEYAMVAVSDTGSGIAPELLDRVFEPFFTTKASNKGTGLGLSMVYGFVKQSGGHVKIYSEVGVGTTIRLYLPRAAGDAEAAGIEPPAETPIGRSEMILVVEDNVLVREVVIQQVEGLGYRVRAASNANEALAVVRAGEAVDLLFTDIVMPGTMSGVELAEAVRGLRPGIKILFTSGFAENHRVGGGFRNTDVLLSKPYRRNELAGVLRRLLDRET